MSNSNGKDACPPLPLLHWHFFACSWIFGADFYDHRYAHLSASESLEPTICILSYFCADRRKEIEGEIHTTTPNFYAPWHCLSNDIFMQWNMSPVQFFVIVFLFVLFERLCQLKLYSVGFRWNVNTSNIINCQYEWFERRFFSSSILYTYLRNKLICIMEISKVTVRKKLREESKNTYRCWFERILRSHKFTHIENNNDP